MSDSAEVDPIPKAHAQAKAQFEKLREAEGHLSSLRVELDRLGQLGDMIEPDDVVKSASNLVARGFTPEELGAVLASMPVRGGPMLAQWIATHDESVRQMEASAKQVLGQAGHALAVTSLHMLARDHAQRMQGQTSPAAPQQPIQAGMTISEPSTSGLGAPQ